jgi:hypothetical protein
MDRRQFSSGQTRSTQTATMQHTLEILTTIDTRMSSMEDRMSTMEDGIEEIRLDIKIIKQNNIHTNATVTAVRRGHPKL